MWYDYKDCGWMLDWDVLKGSFIFLFCWQWLLKLLFLCWFVLLSSTVVCLEVYNDVSNVLCFTKPYLVVIAFLIAIRFLFFNNIRAQLLKDIALCGSLVWYFLLWSSNHIILTKIIVPFHLFKLLGIFYGLHHSVLFCKFDLLSFNFFSVTFLKFLPFWNLLG